MRKTNGDLCHISQKVEQKKDAKMGFKKSVNFKCSPTSGGFFQ